MNSTNHSASGEPHVRLRPASVSHDPLTGQPALLLRDLVGHGYLELPLRGQEVTSLTALLEGVVLAEPSAQMLAHQILVAGELRFLRAELSEEGAAVVLESSQGVLQRLAARPVDAVALALQVGGDIYAETRMITPMRGPEGRGPRRSSPVLRRPRWRL